jgi:dodecin
VLGSAALVPRARNVYFLQAGVGETQGKWWIGQNKGGTVSVARVTELSATSETSFEDAIQEAVARATSTLRGVEGAWIKDQNILIEDGNITGYKVNLEVTFVLEP